jgi:drug/metabolite transporter (DMT)-like permease
MNGRERHLGALAMIGATSLWGVSSGVVSASDTSPLWLVAVYGLVVGTPMLAWGLRLRRPWSARWVVALFGLDTVTVGGFFIGLGLAPVGPVVALHLASPVLILLYEAATRQAPLTRRRVGTLALIVAGCSLAAYSAGVSGGGPMALLGLGLSLLSAVSVAATNVFAVRLARRQANWQMVVGLGSLVRGCACVVLALTGGVAVGGDAPQIIAAAALAAGGVVLMWAVAAPRIVARTISIIGLNEAVVATFVAVVVFAKPLSFSAGLATVVILAAIAFEVLEPTPVSQQVLSPGVPG